MKLSTIIHKKDYMILVTDENKSLMADPSYLQTADLAIDEDFHYRDYLKHNHDFCKEYGFQSCLTYLSYASRTEQQISDHLTKKAVPYPIILEVIEKLKDYRLIDDLTYARHFIDSAKNSKKGKRYISQKLTQKGIDERIVDQAINEYTEQDEKECLLEFIAKQDRLLKQYPPKIRKEKIYRKSIAQGFPTSMIADIISEVDSEVTEDHLDYFNKQIEKKLRLLNAKNADETIVRKKLYQTFMPKGVQREQIDKLIENFHK